MSALKSEAHRRTAVIIQPMFFPWRGQFDLMSRSDVVVMLDTVQWVHRHWYNRNLVQGLAEAQWMTVPVLARGHRDIQIKDILIETSDRGWRRRILEMLRHAYGKSRYYHDYRASVEMMVEAPWTRIAPLAQASVEFGMRALGRSVPILRASDLNIETTDPIGRLVEICRAVGANRYISGPAAKAYIGTSTAFSDAGISLDWMTYDYPPYPRGSEKPDRELSILDLLFHCGPTAPDYIWTREAAPRPSMMV